MVTLFLAFLRIDHIVLCHGCTNLLSHQQCRRVKLGILSSEPSPPESAPAQGTAQHHGVPCAELEESLLVLSTHPQPLLWVHIRLCPFAISNVSPPHPFLPLLLPLPWSKHLSSFACTIAVSSCSSPGPLCSVTSARGIFRSPCLFPRVKKAWWCHVILRLKSRSLRVAWKASSASGSPRPLLPSLPHAPPILSVFWHHLPCPGKRLALPPPPRQGFCSSSSCLLEHPPQPSLSSNSPFMSKLWRLSPVTLQKPEWVPAVS